MRASLVILAASACVPSAFGRTIAPIPHETCFSEAAERHGLSKRMLVAIAKTESALRPHVVGPQNANGTFDIGMMQINSAWLPTLGKFGIMQSDLFNPCTNIHVGAWILASNIKRYGYTWKAVGAYNAVSQDKQIRYVAKVQKTYAQVASLLDEVNR